MISIVVVSKDEPALDATLRDVAVEAQSVTSEEGLCEVVVVDASERRLEQVRHRHPTVRWIDYVQPPGRPVTIAHQRNVGVAAAAGDIIVFIDSGCRPTKGWLTRLVAPIRSGDEDVVAGPTRSVATSFRLYDHPRASREQPGYLRECPTINLAVRRDTVVRVGGFDESFRYGSDVDLSWRLQAEGHRLRLEPDAVVEVDWGDWPRQVRRSFTYGRARLTLYRRHPERLTRVLRDDPVLVAWPAYLLGLPVALRHPSYLALLVIPAWRNRDVGPVHAIVDHTVFAAGALVESACAARGLLAEALGRRSQTSTRVLRAGKNGRSSRNSTT